MRASAPVTPACGSKPEDADSSEGATLTGCGRQPCTRESQGRQRTADMVWYQRTHTRVKVMRACVSRLGRLLCGGRHGEGDSRTVVMTQVERLPAAHAVHKHTEHTSTGTRLHRCAWGFRVSAGEPTGRLSGRWCMRWMRACIDLLAAIAPFAFCEVATEARLFD